jgi:hypothetical protein
VFNVFNMANAFIASPVGGVSMPEAIPKPIEEATAGSNSHRRPSLDFRSRRELDWSAIESAIHELFAHATAVEMIGRGAEDNIHGEKLEPVFSYLSDEMEGRLNDLWELLGFTEPGAQP